jgi:predicted DNA-binding transcriptional regulator YafY
MSTTSARMLRLLSLLQTHRHWPGAELAARLEVSVRTLRRDVDRLRELGYPVDATRGVDGGYQLAAGAALPPLLLDDDEAVAIAVGMQAATQGAIDGIEESAVRALTKVVQVMPPPLRRRVDALRAVTASPPWTGSGPVVAPEVLVCLALACRDSERLRFGYTARGGERTQRLVEPHRLVPLGRRWYLVAYDLSRHDWRSFRLDRLTTPKGTGERFRSREIPGGDAVAFVRAGIAEIPQPYRVEVLAHASAEHARDRVGRWFTVEEVDPSTTRLVTRADTVDWPAFALGLLGADFRVLSPPELVDQVRDWGARFSRAASTQPDGLDAVAVPQGAVARG